MTYQDPDPLRDRDLDPNAATRSDLRRESGSNAMWGWIAGAIVLVLMLVFLFGGTQNPTTTDANNAPSQATVNTPPANNTANAPRPMTAPADTTGQGQPQR
jgi:hypothetical protein